MTLKPQKRSQAQPNVITPRPARANLRPLDQAELLDATVIDFNRPSERRPLDSLHILHLNFVGGPQLNIAVCGDDLEDANQAIAFARTQVDAADHRVVFTRPMARHQLDLLRIGLIQGRVVYDKDALAQADLGSGLSPQRRGVRLKAMQQAGERVMGRRLLIFALRFRRFGHAHRARRGDYEVNVVLVRTLGRIHALFLLHFPSTTLLLLKS